MYAPNFLPGADAASSYVTVPSAQRDFAESIAATRSIALDDEMWLTQRAHTH